MPAEGIAIEITVAIEKPLRIDRIFAWPARVSRDEVHAGFEGLPRRVAVYQASGRVGVREVFIFVFFGQATPTVRQLAQANTELRRARLS
jgi:hypothetical protein